MRQNISHLQKIKSVLHITQAVLIFIAGLLSIAEFASGPGHSDGRLKWFFTMCWLSIPAIIYLTAVPMWTRARNLAKSLWFAVVDVLFTIFWLSAFAAVLTWLRVGIHQGAKDSKIDTSRADCTVFAYGNKKQCQLAYACSSMGVLIFLLFIGTSGISILYTIRSAKDPREEDPWLVPEDKYKLPPASSVNPVSQGDGSEDAKSEHSVWDANTQELDGQQQHHSDGGSCDSRDDVHANDDMGALGGYTSVSNSDTGEGIHPGRLWGPLRRNPVSFTKEVSGPPILMEETDTSYKDGGAYTTYQTPSALSPRSHSPVDDRLVADRFSFSKPVG